ncbi:hypothetical protein ABZV29_08725 [Streptomyces sp. NPDC005236]|uniref:hypothetical protein n=1 Tax=Streptomyces sp. NPDC005236 TaxID=3157028 RepID=UPI0033B48D20
MNNAAGGTHCSGWIDWASTVDTGHFSGLNNRVWVDPGHSQESLSTPDNIPALTRICVQAIGDDTARRTAWW